MVGIPVDNAISVGIDALNNKQNKKNEKIKDKKLA